MINKILLDGTKIEITVSDTYSGPDGKFGCQRTSKNANWYRLNGGSWEISPFRTGVRLMEAIELSDNIDDFNELVKACES